jgi:hypothetical protein
MRIMPIGNIKEKIFSRIKEGNPEGVVDIWCNVMSWHHFLDKCGLYILDKKHEISFNTFYIIDSSKEYVIFYQHYNWLTDSFSWFSCPDAPIPEKYPIAQKVNPWKLPGQRYIENFSNNVLEGKV